MQCRRGYRVCDVIADRVGNQDRVVSNMGGELDELLHRRDAYGRGEEAQLETDRGHDVLERFSFSSCLRDPFSWHGRDSCA